ncbi:MAG: tRNA (adenosine(37)-N6)-threonylcarbamoyltransferase complex dimerization subunit type 1 TsaB [Burkholderiaceae bacterium]|nr:tRNA (adenosine(37)-N6)-threonylcarbamoyltransferase complex dimerization subunit type 1 TsaB [Burkholderiaceae bacterium]
MTLYILALETSSSLCGVALLTVNDSGTWVNSLTHDATAEHAERLLPMVDQLLAQEGISAADLDAVAFGQGPGGFTGLRVACGVAQGIAFALDIPVIPIVSLLAVAARDQREQAISLPGQPTTKLVDDRVRVVIQDARMGELYVAAYALLPGLQQPSWRQMQAPLLLDASDLAAWLQDQMPVWAAERPEDTDGPLGLRLLGDGLLAYPELAATVQAALPAVDVGSALRPDVVNIAWLGWEAWQREETIAPDSAAPLYVRDKVAYTTREREQGLGGNPKAPGVAASVHPMTQADLDAVAAIEQSVQSFPWTRRNFEDGLKAGYGAWVSRQAGQITGFCMAMFAPDVAHVLVLAVRPEHQKTGLGAMLLRECEHLANTRGLPALILEVRPSNVNAVAFYQRQGYTVLATRKDYYPSAHGQREDALVMEKKLLSPEHDHE